jgi:hypothetical protein
LGRRGQGSIPCTLTIFADVDLAIVSHSKLICGSIVHSIGSYFAECVGTQFVSVAFGESNYSKGAIVLGGNITQREVCKRYRFESGILH